MKNSFLILTLALFSANVALAAKPEKDLEATCKALIAKKLGHEKKVAERKAEEDRAIAERERLRAELDRCRAPECSNDQANFLKSQMSAQMDIIKRASGEGVFAGSPRSDSRRDHNNQLIQMLPQYYHLNCQRYMDSN